MPTEFALPTPASRFAGPACSSLRRLALSCGLAVLLSQGPAFAQGVFSPEVAGPPAVAPVRPDGPADAQVDRMLETFRSWGARWGIDEGSVAVFRNGAVVGSTGTGGRTATDRVVEASLAKAITGVCITKLVDAGALRFDDKLGSLLKDYFAEFG